MVKVIALAIAFLLASCASRQVMRDCKPLPGDFYDCETP